MYLCGRITEPHTGLACMLHRFEFVSVVSCVRRYFLRWLCVYGSMKKKRSERESSGFVWMSPYAFFYRLFNFILGIVVQNKKQLYKFRTHPIPSPGRHKKIKISYQKLITKHQWLVHSLYGQKYWDTPFFRREKGTSKLWQQSKFMYLKISTSVATVLKCMKWLYPYVPICHWCLVINFCLKVCIYYPWRKETSIKEYPSI